MLSLLLVVVSSEIITVSLAQEAPCSYAADSCAFQFDKECDVGTYCESGDCFDCDECVQYNYDCESCASVGCYWCAGDAVCTSSPLGASVWNLHPEVQPACREESDWVQTCDSNPDNVWTDPLYDSMAWMYKLINVEAVWAQGITGAGIHVRVNDDGVDATHEEFVMNFDEDHSCEVFLPYDFSENQHGTACASIIAAAKNNDLCAAGIAPDVTLSACNGPSSLEDASELFMTHLDVVDVISNSWGPLPCRQLDNLQEAERRRRLQTCPFDPNHEWSPCTVCGTEDGFVDQAALTYDCKTAIVGYCSRYYEDDPVPCGEYLDLYVSCEFHSLSTENEQGFPKVMAEGRGGKGPIITFAGGNDYGLGVDANSDGMVNSRYTIAVGAVGKDGKHASYSTTGAAIFVTAPGGDRESLSNNIVARAGGGCHDVTIGTSFATPVVSAVAALMLQANKDLGWRDVQGILAKTAQRVNLDDPSWYTNAAGVSHSYKYGFGLIDAEAAVSASKTWQNWGGEKQIMAESGVIDVVIPDSPESPDGVLAVLTVTEADVVTATGSADIAMESVVVYLELDHGSRGDLHIVLTSPQGTKSILAPSKRPENTILQVNQHWKLMTLRNWGEDPIGSWALEIADERSGLLSNCSNIPYAQLDEGMPFDCAYFVEAFQCELWTQLGIFGDNVFEACCVCGGGLDVTSIEPKLKSWSMVVYGHTTTPSGPSPAPEVSLPSSTLAPTITMPTGTSTPSSTAAATFTPSPTTVLETSGPTSNSTQMATTETATALPSSPFSRPIETMGPSSVSTTSPTVGLTEPTSRPTATVAPTATVSSQNDGTPPVLTASPTMQLTEAATTPDEATSASSFSSVPTLYESPDPPSSLPESLTPKATPSPTAGATVAGTVVRGTTLEPLTTLAPTPYPTPSPTQFIEMTPVPSPGPTLRPTTAPTPSPSTRPSPVPSPGPTLRPTTAPTASPTSHEPSPRPSPEATTAPTPSPTPIPSPYSSPLRSDVLTLPTVAPTTNSPVALEWGLCPYLGFDLGLKFKNTGCADRENVSFADDPLLVETLLEDRARDCFDGLLGNYTLDCHGQIFPNAFKLVDIETTASDVGMIVIGFLKGKLYDVKAGNLYTDLVPGDSNVISHIEFCFTCPSPSPTPGPSPAT